MSQAVAADTYLDEVDQMTVGQKIKNFPLYVKHQIISLKPPGEIPLNPWTCLRMLNRRQWAFWFIGFLGWTWVLPPSDPHVYFRMHLISSACR
jgi:hypothetical protein